MAGTRLLLAVAGAAISCMSFARGFVAPACLPSSSRCADATEAHGHGIDSDAIRREIDTLTTRNECISAAAGIAVGLAAASSKASARDSPKVAPRARLPDGDTQGNDYLQLGGGGTSFAKPRIRYPDFETTQSGLQYKDAKIGSGAAASNGDRVVMDWEGYTIGYNGGVFESKKGPKGGAFDEDKDVFRFVVGQGSVIPGLEQGVLGMRPGGVRQIIVPPELGYPPGDSKHERVGPKPTTFSGYRALDFVLSNPGYVDKTLLFNVRVVRVDKPGDRGFKGGSGMTASFP